jgi:tetratricopeptide (TPR) repeat protein
LSRGATILSIVLLVAACAPTLPPRYLKARAAAERAYAHGRYDEAARHWLEAADTAERRYDRHDARYRAAASLRRARRYDEAQAIYAALAREPGAGERKARVDFDSATLAIERGAGERGYALLEQAILRHPASGVARASVARYVDWLRERGGTPAVLRWLDATERKLSGTELAESLSFARAKELERSGQPEAARDAYLRTAERFPYPRGDYWDDALFHASQLEERLGRYQAAIDHLRRMLAEREFSHLQGSYQRPRFAPAQYRIAELYRDRLGDPLGARREFHRVFSEHDTSVLRDDALWNEALLAARTGDSNATCGVLSLLGRELPDSRYVACAPLLCPAIPPKRGPECRSYLKRQLDELAGRKP